MNGLGQVPKLPKMAFRPDVRLLFSQKIACLEAEQEASMRKLLYSHRNTTCHFTLLGSVYAGQVCRPMSSVWGCWN